MLPMPVRTGQRAASSGGAQPAALGQLDVDQVGGATADHLDEVAHAVHRLVGQYRCGDPVGDPGQTLQVVRRAAAARPARREPGVLHGPDAPAPPRAPVQPWLASSRMVTSGPTALAHRADPLDVGGRVGADLHLQHREPVGDPLPGRPRPERRRRRRRASRRSAPGGWSLPSSTRQADPAPPCGQVVQGDVDRRLGAVVAGAPRRPRRGTGRPGRRGRGRRRRRPAARSTQASAPASDSPVTCHTCGASPQPVTPSLSVTRTTTVSVVVVRRSAVTNGVCSGMVTRVAGDASRSGSSAVHLCHTARADRGDQRVARVLRYGEGGAHREHVGLGRSTGRTSATSWVTPSTQPVLLATTCRPAARPGSWSRCSWPQQHLLDRDTGRRLRQAPVGDRGQHPGQVRRRHPVVQARVPRGGVPDAPGQHGVRVAAGPAEHLGDGTGADVLEQQVGREVAGLHDRVPGQLAQRLPCYRRGPRSRRPGRRPGRAGTVSRPGPTGSRCARAPRCPGPAHRVLRAGTPPPAAAASWCWPRSA